MAKELKLVSEGGDRVPTTAPFRNEGKTPAGWLLAIGLMLASLLAGVGLTVATPALWIAGIVVAVLSFIVSAAMRAAGHGQPPVSHPR